MLRLRWRPFLGLLVCALMASAAHAAEHFVSLNTANSSFEPADLTIQVGDTVTWSNDGGLHNVLADDGSFTSGPPSKDLWVFSFTFHFGGVFPYSCEIHFDVGMVGTVTVEGIFGDGFETGDTSNWSATEARADCSCYFSSDCAGATFCDYGPGGFPVEDICTWVDNKPNGVPDAGCNIPHTGPWGGDICDGICSPAAAGSRIGLDDPTLIRQGVRLWAEALLQPAEAGGGPPSRAHVQQVFDLGFELPGTAMDLGRQVNDVLILSGSPAFYEYYCHFEQHPSEPDPDLFVDLSADGCRASTARLSVAALLAELAEAGSGVGLIDRIPSACVEWRHLFGDRCPKGDRVLDCVKQRIHETAVFLSTPSGLMSWPGPSAR